MPLKLKLCPAVLFTIMTALRFCGSLTTTELEQWGLPATKQNSSVGASLPQVAAVPLAVSRIWP